MNTNQKIALKETAIDVSKTVAGGVLGGGAILVSVYTAQAVGLTGEQTLAGLLIVGAFLFLGLGVREMYRSKVKHLEHLERMREIEAQNEADRINNKREWDILLNKIKE